MNVIFLTEAPLTQSRVRRARSLGPVNYPIFLEISLSNMVMSPKKTKPNKKPKDKNNPKKHKKPSYPYIPLSSSTSRNLFQGDIYTCRLCV